MASDPDAIDLTDDITKRADESVPHFAELGSSGLRHWGGAVYEEPLVQLAGAAGIRVFKEMALNDATISSILYAITTLVRQVEWEVDPPEDTSGGQEAADFLKECMDDMSHSWEDFITEILTMGVFGWSGFEIVYKLRVGPGEASGATRSRFTDRKIGWRKFAIRSQDTLARWVFGDDGGVMGMVQQSPPDYSEVTIPIEKLLLFRTEGNKNNPEGKSWLRGAWRAWYFKKYIEETEGIGIERDLAGIPVAYVPKRVLLSTATPEDKEFYRRVKNTVKNLRRNEQDGVVWPLEYDDQGNQITRLELLSTGGRREFDTNSIISRWDQRIAMTVLADFLMLGQNATGSYALSSDKTDIFTMALKTIVDNIASVINRHAVPRLFAVNAMSLDALPQVRPGDFEKPELGTLATFLTALNGIGVPLASDPETVQWLRTLIEAPQMADETLAALTTQAPAQPPEGPREVPGAPGGTQVPETPSGAPQGATAQA